MQWNMWFCWTGQLETAILLAAKEGQAEELFALLPDDTNINVQDQASNVY